MGQPINKPNWHFQSLTESGLAPRVMNKAHVLVRDGSVTGLFEGAILALILLVYLFSQSFISAFFIHSV
jgi:hypothetical protein